MSGLSNVNAIGITAMIKPNIFLLTTYHGYIYDAPRKVNNPKKSWWERKRRKLNRRSDW